MIVEDSVDKSSDNGFKVKPLKCPNKLFENLSSSSPDFGRRLAQAGSVDRVESIVSIPDSGWWW